MATLIVQNLTASDVFVTDLYATIPASGSVSTTRSSSDLARMYSLMSLITAGTLAASVTYSADEIGSGLGEGGDSHGVEPVHLVDLATAAGLAAHTYDATAKTITINATGTLTVDSVLTVLGDRILVQSEGNSQGGIYKVTTAGAVGVKAVLTRDYDWQTSGDVQAGMLVGVKKGTVNAGVVILVNYTGTFTLDTTTPTFGAAVTATVAAGAGLALAGATVSSKTATPAGTDLTDTATQTIQISGGSWRKLPLLGQGGALTLSAVGAAAGDQITITRSDTHAFTYDIINGGPGAGTLFTMPVSKAAFVDVQFDGTNWALKKFAVAP
jgi:hypothetical protein